MAEIHKSLISLAAATTRNKDSNNGSANGHIGNGEVNNKIHQTNSSSSTRHRKREERLEKPSLYWSIMS